MKSKAWREIITTSCKKVGTYREEFDSVITTLADILEKRDDAYKSYTKTWGGSPVYEYPNKAIGMNPALNVWDTLNKSALAYWRDLGLTPSGLKKIDEKALKQEKKSGLADIVNEILS